jgi:biopolymer transport protein ExbD
VISGGSTVRLPPPSTGTTVQAPRIMLSIASKGAIFIGGELISDAALPRTLRDLASRSKDTQLVIAADKNVPYARVVFVLDHATQAGLTRIAFATAP